jgi:hypothetical protein
MEITTMLPGHWEAVKTIYEQGIATGNATFQSGAPAWEEWDAAHAPSPRLVAIENGTVLGWAALTPVSGRCVYAGVGEVSVYVDDAHAGKDWVSNCCSNSLPPVNRMITGPCRQEFFPRTQPAWPFIMPAASAPSARVNASVR